MHRCLRKGSVSRSYHCIWSRACGAPQQDSRSGLSQTEQGVGCSFLRNWEDCALPSNPINSVWTILWINIWRYRSINELFSLSVAYSGLKKKNKIWFPITSNNFELKHMILLQDTVICLDLGQACGKKAVTVHSVFVYWNKYYTQGPGIIFVFPVLGIITCVGGA